MSAAHASSSADQRGFGKALGKGALAGDLVHIGPGGREAAGHHHIALIHGRFDFLKQIFPDFGLCQIDLTVLVAEGVFSDPDLFKILQTDVQRLLHLAFGNVPTDRTFQKCIGLFGVVDSVGLFIGELFHAEHGFVHGQRSVLHQNIIDPRRSGAAEVIGPFGGENLRKLAG